MTKQLPTLKQRQIKLAQNLMSELPEKNTKCTREEAAEIMAADFKRAFKKGYTPKEIAALLRKQGIIIAAHLIGRYFDEDTVTAKKGPEFSEQAVVPEQQEGDPAVDEKVAPPETEQASVQEQSPEAKIEQAGDEDSAAPTAGQHARHGKFEIIPDTPIGEL